MQTADFYSSATGTLRVNGGRDENAPKGVSLSIDDLSYIKQGSRANEAEAVTDYNLLDNKPQINNVTLMGNKSLANLGIASQADMTTVENNILSVANTGRKNVLHYNNKSTSSAAGVVYTINSDGSITADVSNKTGLSYIILMLDSSNVDVKQYCTGNYILSGCPSGGGDSTYQMYAASGSYVKRDYGDGVVLAETEQPNVYLIIRIETSYSGGNITFKPMIRLVGTDETFEKWAPSNAELYNMILALQ